MELRFLPAETPTTASSCSADPSYDHYCLPHAGRGEKRDRERERERGGPARAVTGPPALPPLPAGAPAVAVVPTLRGGGWGAGAQPDHSYCSWGGPGGRGWEDTGLALWINRGRERGGGERDEEDEEEEDEEESAFPSQTPSPGDSEEEHASALSVYDNLRAASPAADDDLRETAAIAACFPPVPVVMEEGGVSGESSSWSSCEIVLVGSFASNGPDQDQDQDRVLELDSGTPPPLSHDDPALHDPSPPPATPLPQVCRCHPSPPVLQVAQGPPSAVPLQPGEPPRQAGAGARVPPPLPLADPSASALRSLLTSLQQQTVRQREEYEQRIHSLEQRNEDLQEEVLGLRANLAQQRRWYSAVQSKMAEAERARAAADLRNGALQAEMEQFFDTFGELNNEAKKTESIVRSF